RSTLEPRPGRHGSALFSQERGRWRLFGGSPMNIGRSLRKQLSARFQGGVAPCSLTVRNTEGREPELGVPQPGSESSARSENRTSRTPRTPPTLVLAGANLLHTPRSYLGGGRAFLQ